jgi:transcription elongation factor
VRANNLKIKTEIEQSAASGNAAYFMDKAKPAPYSAGDLITYDNNKYVGVVLSVDSMGGPGSDLIRLISEDGSVQNIRGNQVSKRFDQRELKTKQQSVDAKRNTIYNNNVVKIINGVYQGRKGVIKYLHKDVVFLWDKAFQQTNGLFVEKTRNVEILGTEHMNHQKQAGGAAMATMNKRGSDPLRNKEVLIVGGQYKGYRGRVCQLDDRQALVELSSLCKKVPISRDFLKDLAKVQAENGGVIGQSNRDEDMNAGGRTVYEGGRTAYEGNKTPM